MKGYKYILKKSILYTLTFGVILFISCCLFNDNAMFKIILSFISIASFLLSVISLILSLIIKQTTHDINNYINNTTNININNTTNINIQEYYKKQKTEYFHKDVDSDYKM